jgi:creatinine amidohydrolase/Fe(II)-dependent formamide hydrolase-like protein
MAERCLLEFRPTPQAQSAFTHTPFVVKPFDSTDQHGPHPPPGTDFLLAQELV